jgi:cytoskeletal protein RodZ
MDISQDRLNLPWTNESKENKRFSLILTVLFILFLVLAVWIPSVMVPEKDRKTLEKLPPQLAKLVKKKVEPKPKPKPIKKEEAPKKKEEKPETKKDKPKKKPEAKPKKKKVVPKIEKPKPVKKPLTAKVKKAREVAKKSGLLALKSNLVDLKKSVDVAALRKKVAPRREQTIAARAGSTSTADVMRRSSGITTEGMAAPAETLRLAARDGVMLDETEDEIALAKAEQEAASRLNLRNPDGIRLVAESLKSSFSKLYNRELRKDPFLEGLLMLEVVIEPSGEVSFCRVVSSELNHPTLENKIVKRMYLADFGPENVIQTTMNIPFPFHPN